MNLFEHDTVATFPAGCLDGSSTVLAVVGIDVPAGRHGVIVAGTPFHPLDHRWPDQPADTGIIELLGHRLPVLDCVVGAAPRGTADVLVGSAIPARRGDDAWCWLVVHVVELDPSLATWAVGASVRLTVDGKRRWDLSGAHTACHLSGFAINAALAGYWRKPVAADALGTPDFERQALVASSLSELRYHDTYRIGRSLRKAGFDTDGLPSVVPSLGVTLEKRMCDWTATAAPVRVTAAGPGLGSIRTWTCDLPSGTVRVPCGGTHLTDLAGLAGVRVEVSLSAAGDVLDVVGTVELHPVGASARADARVSR
ncbi:hypothetical protein ACFP2T_46795 [Plantactinospora solaniradicis]|uniref:Metal-dependent hydrolase n=1 Tax=Plantactinospora solaniradicis TaxID=1723736 RepID=A0ABW1KPW0_9ACTN